jgi:hypothetical protein
VRAEQLAICCEICWPPNHALKTTVRFTKFTDKTTAHAEKEHRPATKTGSKEAAMR